MRRARNQRDRAPYLTIPKDRQKDISRAILQLQFAQVQLEKLFTPEIRKAQDNVQQNPENTEAKTMMKTLSLVPVIAAFSGLPLLAQNATVVSFPHLGASAPTSSAYQGIAATSVTVGGSTLYCTNCVPGVTGTESFANPFYFFSSPATGPGTVTLLIEDAAYTGPCTAAYVWESTSGEHFLSGQRSLEGGCSAGNDYVVSWDVSIPAPITGACGGSSVCTGSALLQGGVATTAGTLASSVSEPMIVLQYALPFRPGIIGPSTVTIGAQIAGLPCFDCSTIQQGEPNLSIATPLYVVLRNTPLAVSMEVEDESYTGPCTLFYEIKQGTTVVASGTHVISGGCTSPSEKITYWDVTIPSAATPGAAVLTGGVIAGSDTFEMGQPILIQ